VYVEPIACDAAAPAEIVSVLRVELLGRLTEGPPRVDAYRVSVDCSGDVVELSVGVRGEATKSTLARLSGAPANIRSRIVALAIAELVRDMDRELPPAEPPDPVSPGPVDRIALPPRAESPSRAIGLGAFAQTSSFAGHGMWLAGGGLRFDYFCRRLCAGFDATVASTTERFAQGTAQVFLSYASPYVAWREEWGRTHTLLGIGYALGAARLVGRATDARVFAGTTTGPFTAPYALVGLAIALTADFGLEARGQAGWVTLPVIGEVSGGPDVAVQGLWASVQAGLAITL
jgi:hypothetical protein